jgi:hypothetical protein
MPWPICLQTTYELHMKTTRQLELTGRFHPMIKRHGPASPQRQHMHTQKLGEREINLKSASSRMANHRVEALFHQWSLPMTSDQNDTDDLIVLTSVAFALAPLIDGEPPKYRHVANRMANGAVPAELVEYIRGRNYVRRSNLLAFAQALGLPLKQPAPSRPARTRASRSASAA